MASTNLHLILGDQLNLRISSLRGFDPQCDVILMCEVMEEAEYVKHHKQKIAFILSAMRHFSAELQKQGFQVRYITLDDPKNRGSLRGEVSRAINDLDPRRIIVTEPGEYRLLKDIQSWQAEFNRPVEIRDDDRFLCSRAGFARWSRGRKQLRMEYFYREMRKQTKLLMNGNLPEGGQWNYDSDNRKPLKAVMSFPAIYRSEPDDITRQVIALVGERFPGHFGELTSFCFAVSRAQALEALQLFVKERLSRFGDYQDAMKQNEPWLFHSHLSSYINCGLLLPLECAQAVEEAYRAGHVPLNAAEGFVRQIIGWREFVRGVYWSRMPAYERENCLGAKRQLPGFYWSGETDMNCLKQCVQETRRNAYAHHIQRLMVLGNFALIAGIDPKPVNEWFLIVYADAYQWVELPNVTGMALFADGGYVGSKPYAASGAYINKMSDYCRSCPYNVKEKNGPHACPFNYLYWDFLIRNESVLSNNPRMGIVYRALKNMPDERRALVARDSRRFLRALDAGERV